MAQVGYPREDKGASRRGLLEGHLAIGVLAIAATILIRYKVYTPDSNLLVVGVTFLLVYGLLWGLAAAVRKIRTWK